MLTRDKFAFANCVSTRLDFNAYKFFNFPKHDNQKWLQACNNERLKIVDSNKNLVLSIFNNILATMQCQKIFLIKVSFKVYTVYIHSTLSRYLGSYLQPTGTVVLDSWRLG